MSKVIVIGGGPAGMMAAYAAACQEHHVTLLEQNEKLGKKLFIYREGTLQHYECVRYGSSVRKRYE